MRVSKLTEKDRRRWALLLGEDPHTGFEKAQEEDSSAGIESLYLLAWDSLAPESKEIAVGALGGLYFAPDVLYPRAYRAAEGVDTATVLAAFAAHLATRLASGQTALLTWDSDPYQELRRALLDAGFRVDQVKLFAERSLEEPLPPLSHELNLRSLEEVGEGDFLPILTEASQGDPFQKVPQDPGEDFRELVQSAGEAFDPGRWLVAWEGPEPVGVVLPQRYPDRPQEGTIFYLGVLPAHRGRGLGRLLHLLGLHALASAGVERYVGSTDQANQPMARVFQANGCRISKRQLFFRVASR